MKFIPLQILTTSLVRSICQSSGGQAKISWHLLRSLLHLSVAIIATDDYGKITDRVRKLKGSQNYSNWLFKLKRALKSRGVRHWEILIGEDRPQFTSYRTVPSERTLREHIAKEHNNRALREYRRRPRSLSGSHKDNKPPATIFPDTLSVQELEDFIHKYYDKPNKEFQEWEALIFTVLNIFVSCLDYDLIQYVKQTEDASEAFRIIKKLYGRPTQQTIATKWAKLKSTVYKLGLQSAQFMANWQRTYVEVDQALGDEYLPVAIQFSMFVRAIGFHPNATVWLQGTQKFDLKDDRLIENVFADFGTAKDQRYNSTKQHPTLSSNTTKKGAQQQKTIRADSKVIKLRRLPTIRGVAKQYFLNPANTGKSFNKGTTTAKATAELPTSPEDIFINTANVQIDSIDISTISTANASLNPLRTVNLTTLGKDGQIISSIILKNVWHAEDLENSLISCRTMFRDDGIACTLSDYVTLTKTFYASATFTTSATASVVRAMPIEVKPISIDLAYRRFCYAGEQRVRRMPTFAEGIKLIKGSALKTLCPLCLAGKDYQLPYGDNKSIRVRPGDSLHINVWGPISIATKEGETYFMSITDKASRFCWIFLIKARTDVVKCYQVVESYLLT
ncbi:uncharacterized protein N7477_005203 [Penicillium maclennaniae]|uniref:uncharacterized protein n=1 Tax=Penicillium maclennaniae TaxID=1343394 RepID=UPI00253F7AB1|nr:uncharacterized protein N7477_005203 [Penicillium maclennaniae]KAJ5675269.1 hypothetical protein N7477_005203 [Penicillium maclennaniae]